MKTLLLVDDDKALRSQFAFALSGMYEIFEAETKEEAYGIIQEKSISIALIDLGLPPYENSDVEGRAIISKLLFEQNSKVIVLTGQDSPTYAQELIELGVFDYLLKPIEMPTLLSALQRADFFIENEKKREDENIQLSFSVDPKSGLKASSEEAQKQLLISILNRTNFNIYQSAKLLNSSRENIYYFIKKFQIERPLD